MTYFLDGIHLRIVASGDMQISLSLGNELQRFRDEIPGGLCLSRDRSAFLVTHAVKSYLRQIPLSLGVHVLYGFGDVGILGDGSQRYPTGMTLVDVVLFHVDILVRNERAVGFGG